MRTLHGRLPANKRNQPGPIEIVGCGERNPITDNATAEDRSLNRRVELSLIPITE